VEYQPCEDPNCVVCVSVGRMLGLVDTRPETPAEAEEMEMEQRMLYSIMWSSLGVDGPTTPEEAEDPKIMFPLVRQMIQAQNQAISNLSQVLNLAQDAYMALSGRVAELEGKLAALESKG